MYECSEPDRHCAKKYLEVNTCLKRYSVFQNDL